MTVAEAIALGFRHANSSPLSSEACPWCACEDVEDPRATAAYADAGGTLVCGTCARDYAEWAAADAQIREARAYAEAYGPDY